MVCVKCEIELKIEKNGAIVVEMFMNNTEIYKLWESDIWKCPSCGFEIVTGFASNPFAEHFSHNCREILEKESVNPNSRIIYDKERTFN
jgi:hypothetical protein